MTLNQIRQSALDSLEGGELEPAEAERILVAIDRQVAAGRDPNFPLPGPVIDLDRLPSRADLEFQRWLMSYRPADGLIDGAVPLPDGGIAGRGPRR